MSEKLTAEEIEFINERFSNVHMLLTIDPHDEKNLKGNHRNEYITGAIITGGLVINSVIFESLLSFILVPAFALSLANDYTVLKKARLIVNKDHLKYPMLVDEVILKEVVRFTKVLDRITTNPANYDELLDLDFMCAIVNTGLHLEFVRRAEELLGYSDVVDDYILDKNKLGKDQDVFIDRDEVEEAIIQKKLELEVEIVAEINEFLSTSFTELKKPMLTHKEITSNNKEDIIGKVMYERILVPRFIGLFSVSVLTFNLYTVFGASLYELFIPYLLVVFMILEVVFNINIFKKLENKGDLLR